MGGRLFFRRTDRVRSSPRPSVLYPQRSLIPALRKSRAEEKELVRRIPASNASAFKAAAASRTRSLAPAGARAIVFPANSVPDRSPAVQDGPGDPDVRAGEMGAEAAEGGEGEHDVPDPVGDADHDLHGRKRTVSPSRVCRTGSSRLFPSPRRPCRRPRRRRFPCPWPFLHFSPRTERPSWGNP